MKLVILGATGPTGVQLVEECLDQGHEVTALVRSPDKLQIKHDKLSAQKVNIFQEDDLIPHMKGSDACLGTTSILKTSTIYTESVKVITAAMKQAGVTRFVALASWGTKEDPGLPRVVRWFVQPIFLRKVLPDMGSMEDYLSNNCPDLDYTVVKSAQLTHSKSSGQKIFAAEGQGVPDVGLMIPRRDVAKFMLKCVVNEEWKKKLVSIGVK